MNLKLIGKNLDEDDVCGRPTTAASMVLSMTTPRRTSSRRLLPPRDLLTGIQAPLLQKANLVAIFSDHIFYHYV